MIKYLSIIFTTCILFLGANVKAAEKNSNIGWCASEAPSMEWENQIQRIIATQRANNMANGREAQVSYTIPVIVHVCYYTNNSSQNIPANRVQNQITVLNNDFAGIGLNSNTVPAAFAPLIANSNVTFCLAKLDLNNNVLAEPGIDRVNAQQRGWGSPSTSTGWSRDFIDNTIKKATIWDPNYYLNIWVVPYIGGFSSSILGYATFPGMSGLPGMPSGAGNPLNDGFVCRASYFGNTGGGRTSTHEIGHWLGLRHIWGDDSCGTDFVNDTPTAFEPNYGCPSYPHRSCGNTTSGDMFMNFMDYTDDNCMAMFTNDQSARFQVVMQNADFRKNLQYSPVCDTVKQKPVAKFSYLQQVSTLCATSKKIDFTDKSLFAPTSWSWTFEGGTPATSNQQHPAGITFNTAGIHNVKLVVSNSRGVDSSVFQVNVSIVGNAAMPLLEDFEGPIFPSAGWDLVNRNGNAAINWDRISGYSAFGVGNNCMRFDNTTLDGRFQKDDIMTPKLNLTGVSQATLKFDVSHAPFYGQLTQNGPDEHLWDTLEVLITDNCQQTTQRIYRKGDSVLATVMPGQGDEFYPQANQWRTETIVIPASYLNKQNVQIIFRNYGDFGHTIYVDNINVFAQNSTPTATASFTVSDTTVCVGGSLTFTNTSTASSGSPDSVRWTILGGTPSTSNSATTVTPTFNTAGTYVISLIAYKSGNASVAATKSIRVKSLPTVSVTSPAICSGKTAQPVASGATSYTWTGGLSSVSNPVTPALTTTTTYTVTGTKDGCTGTAVSIVTVNATPSISVTSPAICSGQTAQPVASGTSTSYSWTGGLTSVSNPVTPALSTTTTYTVMGTLGTCTNTAVSTVTVNPKPTVNVTSPTICTGQTAQPVASGTSTSYSWTGGLTSVSNPVTPALTTTTTYTVTGTLGSCTNTAVSTVTVVPSLVVTVSSPVICAGQTAQPVASGATSYTWTGGLSSVSNPVTPALSTTMTYTVTGTSGSCSATAVATVTVNANPTVNVSSPTICAGETAQPVASGTSTSYSWTGGLTSVSNPVTPALSTTTTYTVTGTLGTCTNTAVSTVTVNPKPTVTVTSPGICSGQTAQPIASGATSYSWTGGLSSVSNPVTPPLTTTTTYTVTGTVGSCTNTAVSTVTVASSLGITVNSPSTCSGQAAQLSASGATSYTWTGGLTSVSNPMTPTLTTTTTYTVTGTTGACTGTAVATVTVNPNPTVSVTSPAICSGETAQPVASGATSYSWTGGLSSVSNPVTPPLTTTTTYTVTGTKDGCTGTAVSTVSITGGIATPIITQSHDTLYSSTIVVGANYEWYKSGVLDTVTTTPYYKITVSGSYTLKVVNGLCESMISAAINATVTGIKNNTNSIKELSIYPNPTEGRLVLDLSLLKTATVGISIYTPEGRELYVKTIAQTRTVYEELQIETFAKGIYIIKINVDEEVYYHKVVKQ
ncbi:MAG TPA: M43 family zinc metalloprotease [Chitinophagales bacterium]|nr:M43 family zinc metalloprotease [Chitinophagales bacterium]